ncbi:galactokinase [Gephyromycinifex aptenodytis]|uniref:galactokinase n=1 Tax=Gephyromycinifex aptenodytis TaxID=2716227 RepID=UPI0029CA478B|nr:galactokinase [Gephyromycinifex aptenodytis]
MSTDDLTSLRRRFREAYGCEPAGVWAAPGRVNLIGEHTDYNDGFVLPLALTRRCRIAAAPAAGRSSRVLSLQQEGIVEFDAASVTPEDVRGWAAYVAGMFWALGQRGLEVPELDMVLDSDVPVGAGLSSSAAIECATGAAATDLGSLELSPTELALTGQRCENDFVGAATGNMDQLASMHGKSGHLVFIDTRSLAVENVPFDLPAAGLALLVIDTCAPHALVDGQYAARRSACEQAAQTLGVQALRDVAPERLDDALARITDPTVQRRVRHVVTEDARVLQVVQHLRAGGDPRDIGPALTQSHASLRDDFEVTVPHLDVAVEAALQAGAYGARMTGGGFGGSAIALVEADAVDQVSQGVRQAYAEHGFAAPQIFPVVPADGAKRLD